jgi:flagellar protein FlaG
MDGIANVARQQQSQVSSQETQGKATESTQQQLQKPSSVSDLAKQIDTEKQQKDTEINTIKDVENLVKDLNKALAPMSTSLKFGVDSQDVFYVSVIESDTNKVIRRFPAEQAQDFLPKMQEVSGILFDAKG